MARTKYLIFMVTIGVLLDNARGGVLSPPSNALSSLDSISDQPKNIDNGIAENLIKHLSGKNNDDENTSVKYEVVGQQEPIYGQQYETVANPLEAQLNKTENYYYNQYPILSNNIPSLALSPPILKHQESGNSILNRNIPLNPYNNYGNSYTVRYNYPGLYTDTRQTKLYAQSEPLLLSNAQTIPPLYPNYQNYLINAPQYIAPTLPPRASQSLVSENPISIYQNVQNVFPSLPSLPVTNELYNIPSGLTNLEAQNSLPANIAENPIEPIVTKHIYFHAAPPDYEETPVPTLPPKKTYKIIFIKLPSQEPKNSALLQNLYSNYAAREDKTLIYVLVKKPEEQRVIAPKTTPSQHEVIFVKYKDNKLNSGNIISNGVEQKLDDSLILKPGLVNGL